MPKKSFGSALSESKGFTLIELLIVISIIGVLAAVGFVSYSSAQAKARDSRRKQDLSALATALELYYGVNRTYPVSGSGYYISTTNPSNWLPDLLSPSKFINVLPTDPLNTGDPKTGSDTASFGYSYWSNPDGTCGTGNTYYLLETKLENPDDPDSNKNKLYKDCTGTALVGNGIYAVASE